MNNILSRPIFKEATVAKILQEHFSNQKTKLNAESSALVAEYLGLFVQETLNRAVQQAKTEGSSEVEGGHLEKVVPQILLDFS